MDAEWRRRYAQGNVIVVRYADDSVFRFKDEQDARRFCRAMQERLTKFWLKLMRERHESVAIVGKWPNRVVQGWVLRPTNF